MALIDFLKPTMVGKKKKGALQKKGVCSGPSVQEHSNDRFVLPTSPQRGNEKEIVNIQVSPNDLSLDSQANNEPPVNDPDEKLHSSTANSSCNKIGVISFCLEVVLRL